MPGCDIDEHAMGLSGDNFENHAAMEPQPQDLGKNKGGKNRTTWEYRSGSGYAMGVDIECEENKQGGQGREVTKLGGQGRKVTTWIHRTRITCLRLIHRLNPFGAKDSGLMWQQIADQIHDETAGITERNARGKVMDCQVHSDGTAVMMWYRRQIQKMEETFNVCTEKTQSGQGGMSKQAAARKADETNTNQDEIEQEWEVLRSLKALQEDANRAATMKKQKVQHLKDIKNQLVPEEVHKVACDDEAVRMALITELERRMKKCEQEIKVTTAAGRCQVMTEQQQKEQEMLAEMKQIQRAKKKGEGTVSSDDDHADTGGGTTSDGRGRGKNNLKTSFDAMTQKMIDLTEAMKQDIEQEKPMSLAQCQQLLADLDDDIRGGLRLEGEERHQLRMIFLTQYAKSKKARLQL